MMKSAPSWATVAITAMVAESALWGEEMTDDDDTHSAETARGAADDETTVVPDVRPTQAAPDLAWSSNDDTEEIGRRSWRQAWGISAAVVGAAILLAAAFGAGWLMHRSPGQELRSLKDLSGSSSRAAPTTPALPAQAGPRAARPDDDEFVAVAISPSSLGAAHRSGFGTSGTQERANQIALSECKAFTGSDDCLPVGAGMFHGCVSYAIDSSLRTWASGSGADLDSARADALRRLGLPAHSSYVQCSNPPGIQWGPEINSRTG